MKIQCLTCDKSSDTKRDFYELSGVTGNTYICKSCAHEIGIKNFFVAGLCSNTKALKKYVKLHPDAQYRLEQQLGLISQYKTELKTGFAELTKNYSQMTTEQLESALKKHIVPNPGLILQVGETCYFTSSCRSIKYKDVVVGSTRTSTHFGGSRKGIYLGTGTSQQINNRQIVTEEYPGTFFLTNKRMVCNSLKLSFEIPLEKITAITCYADGLSVMSNGKNIQCFYAECQPFKRSVKLE